METSLHSRVPTRAAGAEKRKFTVVLMTIYSVENAGIRYISVSPTWN